jgi:pimeloyl-ACP methyl ester carboxylesterase
MRSAHGLIGYSMGGRLALTVALTAGLEKPEGVGDRLRLPGSGGKSRRAGSVCGRTRRAHALSRSVVCPPFWKTWYDQPLFASLRKQPALRQALVDQRSGGRADELARALRGLSVGHQRPLWNELPGLQTPALFVAGEEDAVYGATARRAADLSPLGRSLMVPACGHMPHLEQPALCLDAVAEFVQQHVE